MRSHRTILLIALPLLSLGCDGLILPPGHFAPTTPLASLQVPGTANPWLAGAPDGTTARRSDSAPANSPVPLELPSVAEGECTELVFAATGGVHFEPGCESECGPADGDQMVDHEGGAENGIAGARIPFDALVGVYLGPSAPIPGEEPEGLDFGSLGLDFANLSPDLAQPFFIGDGETSDGWRQGFSIPAGATRLFLGSMDGYDWYNNSGAFDVEVSTRPCT